MSKPDASKPDDWRSSADPDKPKTAADYQTKLSSLWLNPNRPVTMSLLAYVAIAIGYIGFIWKPIALTPYVIDARKINPNYVYVDQTAIEYVGAITFALAGTVVSAIQIAGGIGLLKMRRWGVRLMMIYAACAIVMTLGKSGYNLIFFDRVVELQMQATTQPVDVAQMRQSGALVIVIATLAQLVWPAIILTILTRRHVRDVIEIANPRTNPPDA